MSTQEKVMAIVANVVGVAVEDLRLDASLKDDLGATSLDRYTVLMDIEDAFGLDLDDLPEDELEGRIRTVADIISLLKDRGIQA
ncbi:MAG: acyl carrier protein [Deltaproteobacteria bacterium]|nr:acyl carrier protein [Deltaproteobacteria bacterium]